MIYDDFDIDDEMNQARDVSLASTKLVVGQHVQILAERLVLNQTVGRQSDEVACIETMISTLQRYLQVLKAEDIVTEAALKKELADIYESSQLLTPEELASQLDEIRKQNGMNIDADTETGID